MHATDLRDVPCLCRHLTLDPREDAEGQAATATMIIQVVHDGLARLLERA